MQRYGNSCMGISTAIVFQFTLHRYLWRVVLQFVLIHGQRETQRVINIIIAGNGLTLTLPALLLQNPMQTGREKGVGWENGWKTWEDRRGWKIESESEEGVERAEGWRGVKSYVCSESRKRMREKEVLNCEGGERWWRDGVVMRSEGRRTQEADIGMENDWIDGVLREQHGGWCILVTERGWNTSLCDIFNPWCFCNQLKNNVLKETEGSHYEPFCDIR